MQKRRLLGENFGERYFEMKRKNKYLYHLFIDTQTAPILDGSLSKKTV